MYALMKALCEAMGYPVTQDGWLALLQEAVKNDCPGICKACGVSYDNVEPDARSNYCEDCGKQKVVSALVLGGLI
jgi:hypothetical protein